ncbi:hypothetical protein AB0N23_05630 [Streptomyces sp. NPDC052644]
MRRTAEIRWTSWTAALVALGLLAACIWWRESDTVARWRFEEAMRTYCGGVLAYEESPLFEGLATNKVPNDHALGPKAYFCQYGGARTPVTVALLDHRRYGEYQLRQLVSGSHARMLPVPLAGGWRGTVDDASVGVLLPCRDSRAAVYVTVGFPNPPGLEERQKSKSGWVESDRFWARFATATAVKAAAHWDCDAEPGQRIRALPPVSWEESIEDADGTCASLPFGLDKRLDTVEETVTGGHSLREFCRVGASHYFSDRYSFSAHFGPAALRAWEREIPPGGRGKPAGRAGAQLWGSARCHGDHGRALFEAFIPPEAATVWLPGETGKETFGAPAFTEFVKRTAKRHGCTDLHLSPLR